MRKLSVRDQIVAEVKRRITCGAYSPGDFMPAERQLAREFRTSRTTISQALAGLQEAGLVEPKPGRGTRVLPLSERPSRGAAAIVMAGGPSSRAEGATITQGMHQRLNDLNQHCEFVFGAEGHPDATVESVMERYTGALFLEAAGVERLALELERKRFPCVVANLEMDLPLTATRVDHRKTTYSAVQLLVALGHRRIAFLTRPLELFFYRKALDGYRQGLRHAGIAFDDSLVITSGHMRSPVDSVGAYVEMRKFLATNPAPTAIVACRDYLAGGACRACEEAGLEVGRDVSVIGFDDVSWPQPAPFLTTFREPTYDLGAVAAEMLVDRLVSGWRPVERREVEAPLVLRRSIGPCPGHRDAPQARDCAALLQVHAFGLDPD